ncbi:hypothetical protein HZS_2210 [Henneguya salminicola]|nr:hypothetical protein HZS_2210 [Henneguya salminicola]
MSPQLSYLPNNQPLFHHYWFTDINRVQHEMMIWATNQSLFFHTFVDGTFRTTPSPFYQCLIILVFNNASDLHIRCVFVLVTGKNEHIY